jgi:DnaJ-class molecular chaperone
MNYYEILGVPIDATEDIIKERFRKLSKKYHPDISADAMFDYRIIIEAYKVLIDRNERAEYDKKLQKDDLRKPAAIKSRKDGPYVLPQNRIEYCLSLDNILKNYVMMTRSFRHRDYLEMIGQDIIVHATPLEIRLGSAFQLEIPARSICPECRGSRWECRRCRGKGYIRITERINILLPGSLNNGEIIEVSPQDYMRGYSLSRIKKLRIKVNFIDEPTG